MPSTSARKAAGASQPAATRVAAVQRGTSPSEADRGVAQPAGDGAADTVLAATIMSDIRHLGRLPLRVRGQEAHKCAERNLAARLSRAKEKGIFTREQLQELDSLGDAGGAPQPATTDSLMNEIRSLGRLPRRVRGDAEAQQSERNLAQRMTTAKKQKRFSEAQLAELSTFAAGCGHVA